MEVKDPQSETPDTRVPFFKHFIKIIQRKKVDSWFICLLGDIGSGKTGAMVHLFLKYAKWYSIRPSMPSNIKLYTMNVGYEKLKKRIDAEIPSIKKRNNTILLLDALDECEEARESLENTQDNNPRIFMKDLAKDFEDFAWVMVSCRRQFFQQEEFTPGGTGVRNGDVFQDWYKLYLQPFDEKQTEKYLAKRFKGSGSALEKKEARRIVSDCKEEFLRPIILSNIDIILKEFRNRQKPLTRKEIYDAIILSWIKREAKKEPDNKITEKINRLLNASLCTAAYMYKRKLNYLNDDDYKAMCEEYGIEDSQNILRVQSLLTNDKAGFRFAHQSFYEHLLAYWFFLNPRDIGSLLGLLESTLPAYVEILNEDIEKPTEMSCLLGVEKVDDYTIATGLHNIGYGLYNLNHFSEAEPFYNKALELYRALEKEHPGEFIDDVAMTLGNLAILHWNTNHHDEAEKEYSEVLEIFRKLAKENPDAYMPSVATTLNNLGVLHSDTNRNDEAEKEYSEALKAYRELADKNPDAYMPRVADTLNNLAILHRNTNRYEEAEKEYGEALKIRRKLADKYPHAYMSDIADTLNNLAILHCYTNRYDKAAKEYGEALKIYRELAKENPDVYMPDVAMTLNNLANLHSNTNHYEEAEKEYGEALKIRRKLADKYPDAYMPDVATTLNNLGELHRKSNCYDETEKEYAEALKIRRELTKKNPDAHMPHVAGTLNNLALLHSDTNRYDNAEMEYSEALKIYRELAGKNPEAYMPHVATMLNNLAILHSDTNRYDEAEEEYGEALKILRKLAEKNPDAYMPYVAQTLHNMSLLHKAKGELAEAEEKAKESLELYQRMAELSHAAFDKYVELAKNLLADIQEARKKPKP